MRDVVVVHALDNRTTTRSSSSSTSGRARVLRELLVQKGDLGVIDDDGAARCEGNVGVSPQAPLEADSLHLLDVSHDSDAPATPRLAPGLPLQLSCVRLPLGDDPRAQRGVIGELVRYPAGAAALLHESPQRRETLVPRVRIHQRPLEPDTATAS